MNVAQVILPLPTEMMTLIVLGTAGVLLWGLYKKELTAQSLFTWAGMIFLGALGLGLFGLVPMILGYLSPVAIAAYKYIATTYLLFMAGWVLALGVAWLVYIVRKKPMVPLIETMVERAKKFVAA